GDIGEEHDVDESPHLTKLEDGGYDVDARLDLEDFTEQTGIALEPSDPEEDVDTLGGLVVSLIGRVPQRGEIVSYGGFEFEVLEADPRRIKRLRLRPPARPQAARRPIWRSALIGWAYGFGQFLAGLYWVAYAFLVDPLQHAWQIPFVALIFPGGLALFTALACAVSAVLWREGVSRILVFTAAYSLAEWLRGHILTGFPW